MYTQMNDTGKWYESRLRIQKITISVPGFGSVYNKYMEIIIIIS